MPRMLARAGILVALLAPSLAFAASDDVTLTTDTVLSVNGITLNVSGSSAAIESMIVNSTNFSVTLLAGSTLEVTAPGREQLAVDNTDEATGSVCNDTTSKIGYVAIKTMTVVVTPSSSLCASGPATPTSGGTSSGGGGGGSAASSATTVVPTTPTATTTSATVTPTTTTPAAVTTSAVSASGLSASQIQSIIDVLVSFDVDAATLASVKVALNGSATTGSVTSAAVQVFKSNLTVGSLGSEVKALQQFLNSHGYPVAANGAGSLGNETTRFGPATKAALIKYQKAKGITPAAGYFGAKTRAAINADS